MFVAPMAAADTNPSPPFIDNVRWVTYGGLPTLSLNRAWRYVGGVKNPTSCTDQSDSEHWRTS